MVAEVYEQMSRSGGQSEAKHLVFSPQRSCLTCLIAIMSLRRYYGFAVILSTIAAFPGTHYQYNELLVPYVLGLGVCCPPLPSELSWVYIPKDENQTSPMF
ncbi:hypothetical protein TNCV_1397781 [Trichonephila clavipes]|nr:hypothetical protein TNCV_1397781 [Trichonephila clavipes]